MKPNPQKVKAMAEMPPPNKKELQVSTEITAITIINYLSKFSPSTEDVCKVLCNKIVPYNDDDA